MIHVIPHEVTEGLRGENEVHRQTMGGLTAADVRSRYPTLDDFLAPMLTSEEGEELVRAAESLQPGSRLLDVGAGYGMTSLYLARSGFRVAVVEPSPDLCCWIETAAGVYGLPLDIYNVSGEFMDRLPANDFDACFFYRSLHHCDDPLRVLANAHALLTPGGKLFLLNEPLLQRFRSKAWFARQLEEGTLVSGHYGGNEHTYYYHEYIAMLRAARFGQVRDSLSGRYLQPGRYLETMKGNGVGRSKVLARRLYYRAIASLWRCGPLGRPVLHALKRLSLLQTHFEATKPPAAA